MTRVWAEDDEEIILIRYDNDKVIEQVYLMNRPVKRVDGKPVAYQQYVKGEEALTLKDSPEDKARVCEMLGIAPVVAEPIVYRG